MVNTKVSGVAMGDYILRKGYFYQREAKQSNRRRNQSQTSIRGRFDTINRFVDITMRELTRIESCIWFVLGGIQNPTAPRERLPKAI